MYTFQSEKEPVISRLKMKSNPVEKVQAFSRSSISNLTFGGTLQKVRVKPIHAEGSFLQLRLDGADINAVYLANISVFCSPSARKLGR